MRGNHLAKKGRITARCRMFPDEIVSSSPEETLAVGARLAKLIPVPGVVLLQGSLGSGKTTLTRGIAEGLGIGDTTLVHSPSFALVNIYRALCTIYHVDLYRLAGERDLRSVGLDEFMAKEGVTVVEWSERIQFSVRPAVKIELRDMGGNRRSIRIRFLSAVRRATASASHKRTRAFSSASSEGGHKL
jgi:tRNA threonylcarbamoyladenosine biosynthesis protein TsaE